MKKCKYMSFDYATIEKIGLNFGKKIHYGLKISKGVIFILYNFIYDFFILSKTHYKKTKDIVSYSVKTNSVILVCNYYYVDSGFSIFELILFV